MLSNYFKIAWRNILKNRTMFGINILGLTLGIASCLLIGIFVVDELSYDRYNEHADRMYRVVLKANINGEELKEAVVGAPIGVSLKQDLPQVENATRIAKFYDPEVKYNNETFENLKVAYADANLLDFFTLPVVKGNATNPLENPNAVVITEQEAKHLFGEENAIGKTIFINGNQQEVTALIKDIPKTSHFHFDAFVSMNGNNEAKSTSWVNSGFATYVLLKEGADFTEVEKQFPGMLEKYMGPQIQEAIGVSYSEFKAQNAFGIYLQPLLDIHLKSDFSNKTEFENGGDIKYVYIFSVIAVFMLIIACINFMNISTATATKRAREVGIRKVLGSNKKQLIVQFITEVFISVVIAITLAIAVCYLALPFFNSLTGKTFAFSQIINLKFALTLAALALTITVLAGAYPAFFLSGFKPITALKSKFSSRKTTSLRSGLVVFQFVISAGLILATLVVYKQLDFILNKDLGYNKEQVLVIRDAAMMDNTAMQSLKNELAQNSTVKSITQSAYLPAGESDNNVRGIFKNSNYLRKFFFYNVDSQYLSTLGMRLTSGRNFNDVTGVESDKAIINKEAAKVLGIADDPLGKQFQMDDNNGKKTLTVIGVIDDFNFESLHKKIEPLVMVNQPYGGLILKVNSDNIAKTLSDVSALWQKFDDSGSFDYVFLDESFEQNYQKEQKMGTVLLVFALLTIFVACLGLFGLVTYTAEQRFKEIGVRKVLGSSVTQIVAMLTKDFLKLILISFVIALPLGYYLMHQWLQDFAYRIEISVWLVLAAAIITLFIAFATISFKSIKAAMQNPIKSLRTE